MTFFAPQSPDADHPARWASRHKARRAVALAVLRTEEGIS